MDAERFFIDGELKVVREDYGVIIGRAKYGRRGQEFRSKRMRMSNGDSTVNVGDLMKMASE